MDKLIPSDPTLRLIGLYMITTAILGYWFVIPERIYWAISQALLGVVFTCFKIFFIKVSRGWFMSLVWLIGLAVYLPIQLLCHWWNVVNPVFTMCLSLIHCALILWVLPLYLGIGVVAATLLVIIYPISVGLTLPLLCSLLPLFVVSLLLFTVIICFRFKVGDLTEQNIYLKDQNKIRASQKLKSSLYEAVLVPSNAATSPKLRGYGFILHQIVRKLEESISFLDSNTPLYKQYFQSIINKFYDWVSYFNRREKAKYPALIQPNKITLDKLVRKVECTLSQETSDPPRLLVEKISDPNKELSPYIICDINQVVYALVQTILRVGKLDRASLPVVRIQLHPTVVQFTQVDPINNKDPTFIQFPATALVISQTTITAEQLPKVKELYTDLIDAIGVPWKQESLPLYRSATANYILYYWGPLWLLGSFW